MSQKWNWLWRPGLFMHPGHWEAPPCCCRGSQHGWDTTLLL